MYQIDFSQTTSYTFYRYRRHQHERTGRNSSRRGFYCHFRFRFQIQSSYPGTAGERDTIYYGQRATNITDDVDVVVYTAAIHPDN